ncbi:hypothetical protein [Couchioplanes azureus]|uniref:hypothetical protein n=1 Tax=Couchioplanes caeruleus TaxID=56438 RepID=UPI0016709822|nr:hypothetical protein [Couchioplanes caeruleus]GGQ41264.1 hypothetical protein GCM10010166_05850 [Couchioplanes caeruleus subsp. azureus]
MGAPADTDELIRRLYEAPPDGFVAGRAAAVAAARKAGDKEAAKRLAALRKPTVAAWLVNLLALRRPELIDDLVELATALRQAQRSLRGDDLRELSQQRRQAVTALVRAAQQLAVEEDPALRGAKLPMAEVEATLSAALAEPDVAEQVRSGRLVKAATYAGFGEVPRPRLRLVTAEDEPAAAPELPAPAEQEKPKRVPLLEERRRRAEQKARDERAAKRRELRKELTAARAADRKAKSALEDAEEAELAASQAVDELEEQIAELERQRIVAQAEVSRRKLARRSAERDASAARRRVGDVEAALEDLDADEPD